MSSKARMKGIVAGLLVPALLLAALLIGAPQAAQAQPAPSNQLTVTVLPATAVTSTTRNTAAPNVDSAGRNMASTVGWGKADIFVLATVGSGATLTATVQFSPDATNWANAEYEYWNGSAIGTRTYQRVFTATGNKVITVPLAGENWRMNLVTAGGTVTTTVKATLRR